MKNKLTACVFTHIVEVTSNPYIDNKMLIDTIKSTSEVLGLKDIKYQIYIDAAMKRLYPELYQKYLDKTNENINRFLPELDIEVVKSQNTGETLRGNWECAMDNIDTPYMLFLEHDWEFTYDVKVNEILKTLDLHEEISYIKFPKHPLDVSRPPWPGTMEVYFKEENTLQNSSIPLSRISFWSGNPHIMRTSYAKEFYIPLLEMNLPKDSKISAGKSFVERDIKKLIDKSIQEYGMEQTHSLFRTYIYGTPPHPQVVRHSGEWCRKK